MNVDKGKVTPGLAEKVGVRILTLSCSCTIKSDFYRTTCGGQETRQARLGPDVRDRMNIKLPAAERNDGRSSNNQLNVGCRRSAL